MKRLLAVLGVLGLAITGALSQSLNQSQNWPSFRGTMASGVQDGHRWPDHWDIASGRGLLWKTAVPGLAHSSPIVWQDRIFVTTAISSDASATFRHGLYGDGDASEDRSVHEWKLYCLAKSTGRILWEQTAHRGPPRSRRHIKSTYANSTPATDGRHVVAFFGSQGLYTYTVEGKLVWKKDLGVLDVGAYNAPNYEWGPASSPIIYNGRVIVQVDTQQQDFLLALDLESGETLWRTSRDELPSWGTPTIFPGPLGPEVITNASNKIRGYDPDTGGLLWELGGSSKITAPTPVHKDGLIVVASGRRPEKPLFVLRGGARGDLTLDRGQTTSDNVVWSRTGRGSYMPTPLIYHGLLYVLANQGFLDAYDLKSGRELYRQRLGHQGGGFSASPVAAAGRLYLASEDGDVFVVRAGQQFEQIAVNSLPERLMATPALSDGVIFVRGERHLYAIGNEASSPKFP